MTLKHLRTFPVPLRRLPVILTVIALTLWGASEIMAGVLVAPTVVFMSDQNRTGRLNIQNPTDQPREVSVRFSYGLPESDSLGNVYVRLQDSNITDPKAALDWIKAFPRKVVIPPNGTQVVRLVASPPRNLPDGEYWARIVITSQEGQTEMPVGDSAEQITTKLNMIMQTAIMLKYRSGECVAQLDITGKRAWSEGGMLKVLLDMVSTGNTSYMGVLSARVFGADGSELMKKDQDIAVYRELRRRIDLPINMNTHPGPYTIEVSVSSKGRNDVAPEDLIPGNAFTYTMNVE